MLGRKQVDPFRDNSVEGQLSTHRLKPRSIEKNNPLNVVNKSVLRMKNLRMQQMGQQDAKGKSE